MKGLFKMKKYLALLLIAVVLCFSLVACGGGKITEETLAGTYKSRLWFLDETITLNSNTTYDSDSYGKEGKGTFEFYNNSNYICLKPYAKYPPNMKVTNDYIYESSYWHFEEDSEYGLKFSPDENGMTDQTFDYCIVDAIMPGSNNFNRIILDLNKDGTFEIKLGYRGYTADIIGETYNGTYSSDSSTLTLKYEGKDYPLYIKSDGYISFIIYDKVA
jgi:hypothetical protein